VMWDHGQEERHRTHGHEIVRTMRARERQQE
jgi:hypothetical protein